MIPNSASRSSRRLIVCALCLTEALRVSAQQVPATLQDFFQPGTQPSTPMGPLPGAESNCINCHGKYDPVAAPHAGWRTSMMAQAARDPLFQAALQVANQDVRFSGDLCLRCHTPVAWLQGRSTPTDGSALDGSDYEGVTCIACHRMADPIFKPGISPPADQMILDDLFNAQGMLPTELHNATFVIDPVDRRRGPFDLTGGTIGHPWIESDFHRRSDMCGTCHDVSNPAYERVGGPAPDPSDTYELGLLNTPHSTQAKYDQFPIERTYSEWLQSEFAQGPIEMGGRFGGNITAVSTCQDCHMPKITGQGCALKPPVRDDLPRHVFQGAGTWVLDAILELDQSLELYDAFEVSGLSQSDVDETKNRNIDMLASAADLNATADGETLTVRVTNQTGHKLPSGYPEGRRMWINARFFDQSDQLIGEYGAYDFDTATLTEDTKIYEAKLGVDQAVSNATGIPVGVSFHFAANNVWIKDNRIPPRGFTNAGFASVQAAPVAYTYADGQYWDDTDFAIPCSAARATVALYYQTSAREYIEFLRDADNSGEVGPVLHDVWMNAGMGAPVEMASVIVDLPDCNANGTLDACDIAGESSSDENENGVPDECESCTTNADCADGNVCTFEQCVDSLCQQASALHGDIASPSGVCGPDGTVNIFDIFAVLDGFQMSYAPGCSAENTDIAGAGGACTPDGIVNIFDIFAVLDAFQEAGTCCP